MEPRPVTLDDGVENLNRFIALLTQAASSLQQDSSALADQREAIEGHGRQAAQEWESLEGALQETRDELGQRDEAADKALDGVVRMTGDIENDGLVEASDSIDLAEGQLRDELGQARETLQAELERLEDAVLQSDDRIERDTEDWAGHDDDTRRRFEELGNQVEEVAQAVADSAEAARQEMDDALDLSEDGKHAVPEQIELLTGQLDGAFLPAVTDAAGTLEAELEAAYHGFLEEVQRDVVTAMWDQLGRIVQPQAEHVEQEARPVVTEAVESLLTDALGEAGREAGEAASLLDDGREVTDDARGLAPDMKRSREVAAEVERLLQELAGA
jgi:DNA repair exonuclease SbcCD ATPase subunit